MNLKWSHILATATLLGLGISVSVAQTAAQHNAPGGPRDRVTTITGGLPPPPPTPPSAPVSTTTVHSPPLTVKKN
jgi:hypothetical protein